MAFKCLRYFVMFKKGPHYHISVCVTVQRAKCAKIILLQGVNLKSRAQTHIIHAGVLGLSALCSLDHLFTVREVAIDGQRLHVRSTQRSPST